MIGALRHKIEILTPTRVEDEAGGAAVVFLPGSELWADVQRLASTRDFTGDRENRLRRIAVTVRYRADIALGQQLIFDGGKYEVASVENEGGGDRRLTLICEEMIS